MKVIYEVTRETANRGKRLFTISESKGKYFAHEIGEQTQFSKVFSGRAPQYNAHRLNPGTRHGNQYGRRWRIKGFKLIAEAKRAIIQEAGKNIIHC